MLQVLLNSAKPMINAMIKEKCQEKLVLGENSFNINVNDLEKLLLEHLGINFLNVILKENEIELLINEEIVNAK